MPLGLIVFVAWMLFMAIMTVAFILWGLREGQFKNIEEPKFRMMFDREPEPWPGREKPKWERNAEPSGSEGGEHGSKRT